MSWYDLTKIGPASSTLIPSVRGITLDSNFPLHLNNAPYETPLRACLFNGVEDLEHYRPGGFHPVCPGDTFNNDRYTVIHKLGYGGSSTVWLACNNLWPFEGPSVGHRLIALKVLSAEDSAKRGSEVDVAQHLTTVLDQQPQCDHIRSNMGLITEQFRINGPNGIHLCLVSPVYGSSVSAMGSTGKRPHADLARKATKQVADVIAFMHSAGFVHGGEIYVVF
jgi:serine/threonine-protein kinase SRPK3